jgi:uncharacterized OB-fold protein
MSSEPALHSRRTLNLRFDIPISKTKEFWEGLKQGRFLVARCISCGNLSFPPQSDCPRCMSDKHEWIEIERNGKILTYTLVQVTPASFVDNDPYIVAIAEFQEGIKILAWLEGATLDKVRVGAPVKLETRVSKEGNPYYVFKLA